jgi:hypothetical protein
LVLSVLAIVSSCSDGTVSGPPATDMPEVVSYQLRTPERVRLLRRGALTQKTSVSRRIGPRGGMLAVNGAMLIVPPGAVNAPVEITLTVPEGGDVRADFQPHGLQFRKPALLAFSLGGSGFHASGVADELIGAYFTGAANAGVITTGEVNPAFAYGNMAAFRIWHFCSYGLVLKKGLILVGG